MHNNTHVNNDVDDVTSANYYCHKRFRHRLQRHRLQKGIERVLQTTQPAQARQTQTKSFSGVGAHRRITPQVLAEQVAEEVEVEEETIQVDEVEEAQVEVEQVTRPTKAKKRKRCKSGGKRKRKQRLRPGTRALREIQKYQKFTGFLIPKKNFSLCVRDATEAGFPKHNIRWSKQALCALQEMTEAYLCRTLEHANLCSIHARRVTIQVRDIQLARRLTER